MTDTPPEFSEGPVGASDAATEEWTESTLPVVPVRELFVTLGKALRAFQLYDENNPVYQRFVSHLRESFRQLWTDVDDLKVQVEEKRLVWNDVEVYREEDRNDSLAFLFYKDGVRDITFEPGIEEAELERFLSVLQKARRQRQEGDDLLIILWEEDLQHFAYRYIDLLAEGIEMPETGDGGEGDLQAVLQAETAEEAPEEGEEAGGAEPASTVSTEDFNPTLYSLDPREMEKLQGEVVKEMERDLRADVLSALFDRLEEPGDRERQHEILGILRTLLPNFLSRGQLRSAAAVLEEIGKIQQKDAFDDSLRAEVKALLDELSDPDALRELVRALQDGTIDASPQQLGLFLRHLRTRALGTLLKAAEEMEVKELRPVLREAVRGIAERAPREVIELLGSDDPLVAMGAARLAGRMQLAEAARRLTDLLEHPDGRVRLTAVQATVDLKASTAASGLVAALSDPQRDVRIAAARALADLGYRPAADPFRRLIQGKDVRQADLTEKIAFFESYGAIGDPKAVEILGGLLNSKGFLGKREPAEIRACAALALGKIGTPEALAQLRAAEVGDDPVVRNAVTRALRTET